jgi:hypothetical protein
MEKSRNHRRREVTMADVEVRDGLHQDPELTVRTWDRQPLESQKAFKAFVQYRDATGTRRLQDVYEVLQN